MILFEGADVKCLLFLLSSFNTEKFTTVNIYFIYQKKNK